MPMQTAAGDATRVLAPLPTMSACRAFGLRRRAVVRDDDRRVGGRGEADESCRETRIRHHVMDPVCRARWSAAHRARIDGERKTAHGRMALGVHRRAAPAPVCHPFDRADERAQQRPRARSNVCTGVTKALAVRGHANRIRRVTAPVADKLTLDALIASLALVLPAQQRLCDSQWRDAVRQYAPAASLARDAGLDAIARALLPQRIHAGSATFEVSALAARATSAEFTLNLALLNLGLHRRLARSSTISLRLQVDVAARPVPPAQLPLSRST